MRLPGPAVSRPLVLAITIASMGCEPEMLTTPEEADVALLVVSGNNQSGIVGAELPQPLVIKATNAKGNPIGALTVNFRVTSGGGSVFAGAASTDSRGIAQDYWTLGTSTAVTQQVEVRAVLANGQKQVFGVFTATPLPGAAATMAIHAGDGQTANDLSAVAVPPAVLLTDSYGNPVPGVIVAFVPASGSGSVSSGTPSTASNGMATVGSWTLGAPAGTHTLTATATGSGIAGNPVTFTATGIGDFWTARASMPTPRQGLGVGVVNGVLYAVGGASASGTRLNTVEAYDPATDTWTAKASMPTARSTLAVGVVNGVLYAVGGLTATAVVNTVEAYDPATDTWTTKAPMLTARRALAVGVLNGILYATGGEPCCGIVINAVEAYNPATDTWTTVAPLPLVRVEHAATGLDGLLYNVGGYSTTNVGILEAYDPGTDTWTTRAPMPTARRDLAADAANGLLYAVGGYSTVHHGTLETYEPATDSWTVKAPMPTARAVHAVGVVNGVLYAVGGGNSGNNALGTVEAYLP